MKNSSKGIIGAIIGCCVIIIIALVVGGYFAAKSIGNQAKIIQQKIEEEQKTIEHNNKGVDLRDNIIEKIETLTSELTKDPDKSAVEDAIGDIEDKIENFSDFIKDASPSDELNKLHKQYLKDANNVASVANSLIVNYDEITKYNELIGDYNDSVDTLNDDNQDIADYISTITTLETDFEYDSDFYFEDEFEKAFDL